MYTRRYDSIEIVSFESMEIFCFLVSHLTRSQTHLSTKSNKQTILNALKRVVLAGPANERQRDLVSRVIPSLISPPNPLQILLGYRNK